MKIALIAGAAALALIGLAGASQDLRHDTKVVTVHLPGGGVERIYYSGDAPPQIVVAADDGRLRYTPWPVAFAASDADSGFQLIAELLDRQLVQMMREADAFAALPRLAPLGGLTEVGLAGLPAGAHSFTVVTTTTNGRTCTRSTEVTAHGAQPVVISRAAGDCGPIAQPPAASKPSTGVAHPEAADKIVV